MIDIAQHTSELRRPKLLVEAARRAAAARIDAHRPAERSGPAALWDLIQAETALENQRVCKDATYRYQRHIGMLSSLLIQLSS